MYAGDLITFMLPLQRKDGAAQSVSTSPTISILKASDGTTVVNAEAMPLLASSVYQYAWDTAGLPDGTYVAFVSYVSDSVVVSDLFLKAVELGDSRITGPVALDATVAKDATVARAAQITPAPDYSAILDEIKAALDALPPAVANEGSVQTLIGLVNDVIDGTMGDLIIDKNQAKMVLLRRDKSQLAQFTLENTDDYNTRTRL